MRLGGWITANSQTSPSVCCQQGLMNVNDSDTAVLYRIKRSRFSDTQRHCMQCFPDENRPPQIICMTATVNFGEQDDITVLILFLRVEKKQMVFLL